MTHLARGVTVTPELEAKIKKARQEYREGKDISLKTHEEVDRYFESMWRKMGAVCYFLHLFYTSKENETIYNIDNQRITPTVRFSVGVPQAQPSQIFFTRPQSGKNRVWKIHNSDFFYLKGDTLTQPR